MNAPNPALLAPTICSQFLSEQIGVRSGSFQPQLILQDLVDQNPVWLNVAVTMTAPINRSNWSLWYGPVANNLSNSDQVRILRRMIQQGP